MEGLVLTGAFDALPDKGRLTRRDLLLQAADLDRLDRRPGGRRRAGGLVGGRRHGAGGPGVEQTIDAVRAARAQSQAPLSTSPADLGAGVQLSLEVADSCLVTDPSGLPEMSTSERVQAELSVLGLDASAHLVDFYKPMLAELGAVRSTGLLSCRSQQEILVGGVKVATQTPPIRSGHRVVFLTLDDGAGPVDATFFPDVQDPYAQTVFSSWLLLVRGQVRRTEAWGVAACHRLLGPAAGASDVE